MLAMPFGFMHSGVWLGFLGTFVLLIITAHCILMLVKSKEKIGNPKVQTYGEVGAFVYGKPGTIAIDVMLFFTQTGFCVAYLVL